MCTLEVANLLISCGSSELLYLPVNGTAELESDEFYKSRLDVTLRIEAKYSARQGRRGGGGFLPSPFVDETTVNCE